MQSVFFHVDLDAFYASVEQVRRPSLKNRPVIVGGHLTNRGVVSACSYEARKYGVHSAMPIFQAKRLCPQGIYLPVNMKLYQKYSSCVMDMLKKFSPSVKQISVDEAFLDMTGTEKLYGAPRSAAAMLKKQVHDETGLTLSIGIAPSFYLAKMASDFRKPDGLYEITPGSETEFIDQLSIDMLWGVGKKTAARLAESGYTAPADIRRRSLEHLQLQFGKSLGQYLYTAVRGEDPGIFQEVPASRSISNERTFSQDITDPQIIDYYLLELSHQVMFRSFKEHIHSQTPFVKFKTADFISCTARTTLQKYIVSAEELFYYAGKLLYSRWDRKKPLRLTGVGLQHIEDDATGIQQELFEDSYSRKRTVEEAVFRMKDRGFSLSKASALMKDFDKKKK